MDLSLYYEDIKIGLPSVAQGITMIFTNLINFKDIIVKNFVSILESFIRESRKSDQETLINRELLNRKYAGLQLVSYHMHS